MGARNLAYRRDDAATIGELGQVDNEVKYKADEMSGRFHLERIGPGQRQRLHLR